MPRRKPVKFESAIWDFGNEKCGCGRRVKILTKGDVELGRKCDSCGWLIGSVINTGSDVTLDNTRTHGVE